MDSLANIGLMITNYTNFHLILNFLRANFVKTKLDLHFFRSVYP